MDSMSRRVVAFFFMCVRPTYCASWKTMKLMIAMAYLSSMTTFYPPSGDRWTPDMSSTSSVPRYIPHKIKMGSQHHDHPRYCFKGPCLLQVTNVGSRVQEPTNILPGSGPFQRY